MPLSPQNMKPAKIYYFLFFIRTLFLKPFIYFLSFIKRQFRLVFKPPLCKKIRVSTQKYVCPPPCHICCNGNSSKSPGLCNYLRLLNGDCSHQYRLSLFIKLFYLPCNCI